MKNFEIVVPAEMQFPKQAAQIGETQASETNWANIIISLMLAGGLVYFIIQSYNYNIPQGMGGQRKGGGIA